jgi:hypothetical protein
MWHPWGNLKMYAIKLVEMAEKHHSERNLVVDGRII